MGRGPAMSSCSGKFLTPSHLCHLFLTGHIASDQFQLLVNDESDGLWGWGLCTPCTVRAAGDPAPPDIFTITLRQVQLQKVMEFEMTHTCEGWAVHPTGMSFPNLSARLSPLALGPPHLETKAQGSDRYKRGT